MRIGGFGYIEEMDWRYMGEICEDLYYFISKILEN